MPPRAARNAVRLPFRRRACGAPGPTARRGVGRHRDPARRADPGHARGGGLGILGHGLSARWRHPHHRTPRQSAAAAFPALSAPKGVPKVAAQRAALLDVALSPDFAKDRLVYLSMPRPATAAGTAVGRGLADDGPPGGFPRPVPAGAQAVRGLHFGSRLVLDGKGHLYIALGENNQRSTAQDLGKLQGKVVRIRTARCRRTILRGQGRRAPGSGPMATAIRRAWR